MLERKKAKTRSHGVSESRNHGVFWWDIEELTFLKSLLKWKSLYQKYQRRHPSAKPNLLFSLLFKEYKNKHNYENKYLLKTHFKQI